MYSVLLRIVLDCLIYYLYLLLVNPFIVFNLNSSYTITEALTLNTYLSIDWCTLYLLSFHGNVHPLCHFDLNLLFSDPLGLLSRHSNNYLLYGTLYPLLHTLITCIDLFIQLGLSCKYIRISDLMEVSSILSLKPQTLPLQLHLEPLNYICEVTLYLRSVLPHILLQVLHWFDCTAAPTCLLESLYRWVQIKVIYHKGVSVWRSQKDQKGLTRGFYYQVLYYGGYTRIIR